MKQKNPNKEFVTPTERMICPNMKMTSLEDVYNCLVNESNEITLDEDQRVKALKALENMHLLGDR